MKNKDLKPAKQRQSNSLGKTSRQQIIETAQKLLQLDGYHNLSTRRVADACGISVGNLTYHFPNKMLLVEAVMVAVCAHYQDQREAIKLEHTGTAKQYLTRTIGFMLSDAVDKKTSDLFLELWVMAKHHSFGNDILENFYQTAHSWISSSLGHYFPLASAAQCQQAAYFMLTLSEGAVVIFARPSQRKTHHKHMVAYGVSAVLANLG